MSAKRVFFGVFQKIMVICGIMMIPLFGGVAHSAGVVFKRFTILCSVLLMIFATPAHADDACKNLFDKNAATLNKYVSRNGTIIDTGPHIGITDYIKVLPNKQYTISPYNWNISDAKKYINYYDANKSLLGIIAMDTYQKTFTTPANAVYMISSFPGDSIDYFQLELGDTATDYVPYNPLCATCDGTVVNYTTVTENEVPAGVQNGTPTPENPIEPVFYQQGNMILRKVGDYADSYDATTGKITRRVGVKVLDGNENWDYGTMTLAGYRFPRDERFFGSTLPSPSVWYCTHYLTRNDSNYNRPGYATRFNGTTPQVMFSFAEEDLGITSSATDAQATAAFKTWLAQQYDAGTPVTVYYPLPESKWYTEDWPSSYCAPNIKIATTAYNSARFNPVKTDLNSAVATIREIVTKTINQTAAIASLQADKQTRPEDACPVGKKCLLVETEENGVIVPHWFPIIEAPEE